MKYSEVNFLTKCFQSLRIHDNSKLSFLQVNYIKLQVVKGYALCRPDIRSAKCVPVRCLFKGIFVHSVAFQIRYIVVQSKFMLISFDQMSDNQMYVRLAVCRTNVWQPYVPSAKYMPTRCPLFIQIFIGGISNCPSVNYLTA